MEKLRSAVKPELVRHMLFRGTLLAGIGVSLLTFGGAFLSSQMLNKWGLLLFLIGGGFIAWGLIPYRRLMQLEIKPNELILDQQAIHVLMKRKPAFTIPISTIKEIQYLETPKIYGIQIWLKKNPLEKVVIQDPHFSLKDFQKHGSDLFLPYFSQNAFNQLDSHLKESESLP